MMIQVAHSLKEAESMKREGKEPIVVRKNEHEVCVFVRSEDVEQILWTEPNWHISEPDGEYQKFTYTRLNEQQLMEFLSDPAKFRGEE